MKNFVVLLMLLAIAQWSNGQTASINFTSGAFNEIRKTALDNKKLIFIDFYTSWCAPCKRMDKEVFTIDSVFKFYNSHFVNYKVDAEKGEGMALKERYSITSYPTYLFLDSDGNEVHRFAGLMPAADFVQGARNSLDPLRNLSAMKTRYEAGEQDLDFQLRYILALQKAGREQAEKPTVKLLSSVTDAQLKSSIGWRIIQELARQEDDRLGRFLFDNKAFYIKLRGKDEVSIIFDRLNARAMYNAINNKDSLEFFRRLEILTQNKSDINIKQGLRLEADFYLATANAKAFADLSKHAMNVVLKDDDAGLSFIARRAEYLAHGNPVILETAYELARQAVALNPSSYSNQITLAAICLARKDKTNGLVAAKAARALANESTSKIQNLAQKVLDDINAL